MKKNFFLVVNGVVCLQLSLYSWGFILGKNIGSVCQAKECRTHNSVIHKVDNVFHNFVYGTAFYQKAGFLFIPPSTRQSTHGFLGIKRFVPPEK